MWTIKALYPGYESSYGTIALSPDSSRVAFVLNKACCYEFDSSVIRSRDGVRIGLGSTFYPQGWVDNETLVGPIGSGAQTCPSCPPFQPDAGLALLRVATPTKIEPLNIKAIFLGLL